LEFIFTVLKIILKSECSIGKYFTKKHTILYPASLIFLLFISREIIEGIKTEKIVCIYFVFVFAARNANERIKTETLNWLFVKNKFTKLSFWSVLKSHYAFYHYVHLVFRLFIIMNNMNRSLSCFFFFFFAMLF